MLEWFELVQNDSTTFLLTLAVVSPLLLLALSWRRV